MHVMHPTHPVHPSKANDLGGDPVVPLLIRLAAPAIVAQLVNALYNIVDRIYIGHMGEEGALALTGVGLCFPIILFITGLAALGGQGGAPRAAIAMGEGDNDRAEKILGNACGLLLMMACGTFVFFQLIKEPMLMAFGATENTIGYATSYLFVYLFGSFAALTDIGLNAFISTQGFAMYSMATVLVGAGCNIILDPIFIFGFGWGVQGAAGATVLSQTLAALWVLKFLLGKRTILKLRLRNIRLDPKIVIAILSLGVSPFIMQSTESLVTLAFNTQLRAFGGDVAVGAMTICSSVFMVIFYPIQGLAQGAQPIISFNYGSGDSGRVKEAYRALLVSCFVACVGCFLLAELLAPGFVSLFNDDPALTATAVFGLRIYVSGLSILWLQMACQQTFVALGQARLSLLFALERKIILLIPLIFILPNFFSNKVFAVFFAEPVADVIASLTCAAVFFVCFGKILSAREQELRSA